MNHQNDILESCIKTTFDPTRSMRIHAMHRWPEVIKQSLWSCAVSLVVMIRNKHKIDKDGFSELDKLISVKNPFNLKDNYTFGYPPHALNSSFKYHNSLPRQNE